MNIATPIRQATSILSPLAMITGFVMAVAVLPAQASAPGDDADAGSGPSLLRLAQTEAASPPGNGEKPIEEVVVTGTSVKGTAEQTGLPIQVLTYTDIARTGATTVGELLSQMPAADSAGSTTPAQATGFGTGGATFLSLRGLGSARTLILINGRRTAPFAGNSVDVSDIPLQMVDHVEVLKDGASAVYGSDAIAGVVNFIMRKGYEGAEVTVGADTPTEKGGGQQERLNLLGGIGNFSSDRYNVTLGLTFNHQSALMGSDRAFATRVNPGYGNDNTSSFAFPANVADLANAAGQPVLTGNPTAPACAPTSPFDSNFKTQCRFDNSPYDSIIPETTNLSATLNARRAVGDNNEIYGEASFWDRQQTTTVQPVPLSYQNPLIAGDSYIPFLNNLLATQYPNYPFAAQVRNTGAFLLPPTSPYYPTAFAAANGLTGQPLNLIYRDFANGLRHELNIANTIRLVAGFKGTAGGWNYDTSILYSQVKDKDDLQSGFPLYSKIMPLLDQGNINPFGPTTDPAALAAAKAAEFVGEDTGSESSLTSLTGQLGRELLSLPGGPLQGVIGFELRRETYSVTPSLAAEQGDIAGQGGNAVPVSASRNVESVYLEFQAPLAKALTADLSARFDNYQNVGNTTNPELWIKWVPSGWVQLRGSAGTGFRAPSLTDLYAPQRRSVTGNGTRDPLNCPSFDANNPSCSFQFTTITGGNPNLTPERSTTYTIDALFEPISNLSLDFNSFWVYLRNQIVGGGLPVGTILQSAATATEFASYVQRDPPSPGFPAGQIISISQTNANLFRVYLSGLDSELKYLIPVGPGHIYFDVAGTYFYRYQAQNFDGTWTSQLDTGFTSTDGVHPRFKDTATIGYVADAFSFSLSELHQKGYHDSKSSITGMSRRVSDYDLVNAQLSYMGLKSFVFTVGVKNLFNHAPPYANYAGIANNFVGGYDLSYGDPTGRDVYANVTWYLK